MDLSGVKAPCQPTFEELFIAELSYSKVKI